MSSLKILMEGWAIGAVQSGGGCLTGIPCVHVDDSSQVQQERIVFGATVHKQELEGPMAYPVDVQIELRNTDRNAANSDAIFAAIEDLFTGMTEDRHYSAGDYFRYLIFFPEEMDSKADRTDNSRIRSRTYPFKAIAL